MNSTLIVYESRYGFTEGAAQHLALILGPARCIKAHEFKEEKDDYNHVVICFPVYMEEPHEKIMEFVAAHKEYLNKRKVALLSSSLAEHEQKKYEEPITRLIGGSVCYSGFIGGRVIVDSLDREDYEAMKRFCHKVHMELKDMDVSDYDKLMDTGIELRRTFEKDNKAMEGKLLKEQVEGFLKEHNTCVMATAYDSCVRATPIEYTYMDEAIYMLSEGGEKFANLLRNPSVSVGIYNSYTGMNTVGGMQITGSVQLIETGSPEYMKLLEHRGLRMEVLSALPAALNLIKILPSRIELLDSRVAKLGYNVKQTMEL